MSNEEEVQPPSILAQLLEYCRFKEIAQELGGRSEQIHDHYHRGFIEPLTRPTTPILPTEIEELTALFLQLLQRQRDKTSIVTEEEWRVADRITHVRRQIGQRGFMPCLLLFPEEHSRPQWIVTFLALLELMKLAEIRIEKDADVLMIRSAQKNL